MTDVILVSSLFIQSKLVCPTHSFFSQMSDPQSTGHIPAFDVAFCFMFFLWQIPSSLIILIMTRDADDSQAISLAWTVPPNSQLITCQRHSCRWPQAPSAEPALLIVLISINDLPIYFTSNTRKKSEIHFRFLPHLISTSNQSMWTWQFIFYSRLNPSLSLPQSLHWLWSALSWILAMVFRENGGKHWFLKQHLST